MGSESSKMQTHFPERKEAFWFCVEINSDFDLFHVTDVCVTFSTNKISIPFSGAQDRLENVFLFLDFAGPSAIHRCPIDRCNSLGFCFFI